MSMVNEPYVSDEISEIADGLILAGRYQIGCTLLLLAARVFQVEDLLDKIMRNLKEEGRRMEDMS